MADTLLDIMEADFEKDPEKFNYRSYIFKLIRDKTCLEELNILYPNISTLGEKIYLYVRKLDTVPEDCKDKIFKGFTYMTWDEYKNAPVKKRKSRKKPNNLTEDKILPEIKKQESSTPTIQKKEASSKFNSENLDNLFITFNEQLFIDSIKDSKLAYMMLSRNPVTTNWSIIGNFYIPEKQLVYLCYLPHLQSFRQDKFITLIKREFQIECEFETEKFPLDILKYILDKNIQSINMIGPMQFVKKFQHLICIT